MKRIIIILLILLLSSSAIQSVIIPAASAAKTASPSTLENNLDTILSDKNSTASTLDKLKQIRDLKEKIATKVTQIRQTSQGAVYGQVKEVSLTNLTLTNLKGDIQFTLNSDITVYSLAGTERKESSLAKITKGMNISVFGIYDEGKKNLDPRFIYIQNLPLRLIGKTADIDKTNYTIAVKENQTTTVVDIEKYTKSFKFDASTNKWTPIGFSKLTVGDFVHILAVKDEKAEDRVHAQKIYALNFLPPEISPTYGTESSPSSIPK